MGLLSDPEYGSDKWVKLLKKAQGPFCVLCYVSAVVYFFMLADRLLSIDAHFSENALLPGLVRSEFNTESAAKQYFRELQEELEDKYTDTDQMPVPWLVAKLSQLHLEVYTHNFTLKYPLGDGQVYKGTNVYGIIRGARTPSLEALVVSAPFRPIGSHHKGTMGGIALMLALAQFARPQKFWAKDIIFLITEHEQLGMQAWLEAYHGLKSDSDSFYTSLGAFWSPSTPGWELGEKLKRFGWDTQHGRCLNPGKLEGRSGAIQAAVNLEIHSPKIKYLEVKVEGLNGQLPNLDLVNLMHKLSMKSGIHHSYKYSYSWIRLRQRYEEWTNSVKTMLSMVAAQIPGVPNGNHGLFHRFGIEAVTLEGRDADDPAGIPHRVHALTPCNFHRLGVYMESVLRSLNNLLERFHQSYFFYLLLATDRFVSIGLYMPSLCLLVAAMLIKALRLWVSMTSETDSSETTTDKSTDKSTHDDKAKYSGSEDEIPGDNKPEGSTLRRRRPSNTESDPVTTTKKTARSKAGRKEGDKARIVNLGVNYFLIHLLGYAVMNSPVLLTWIGTHFNLHSEVSVYRGLLSISVLLVLTTPFLPRLTSGRMTHKEVTLVNILVLIELATVCLILGMLNFSLGVTLAALYTPLGLFAGTVEKGKRPIRLQIKRLLCLLLQPLFALNIGMILYSQVVFPEDNILQMISRGSDATMQAVMFAIVDALMIGRGSNATVQAVMFAIVDVLIYGNWLFTAVTSALFPIWLIFWQILTNPVQYAEATTQKSK